MSKIALILTVVVLVFIAGGLAYLANWDIPPPVERVEKVLPDDRFPR